MDITIESFDFGIFQDRLEKVKSIPEAPDDGLVARAARGDDEAFCRLVELHQERVYRFCDRWLQNSEDAKEMAQDTFVRAYEAIPRYQKQGKFSTWLYRIALNLCRDHFRSKKAKQQRATFSLESGNAASICPLARPDETAAQADQRERMRAAILELPEKLRSAMILFAFEELSQSDCAEILNCSVRAIEGRLYRARDLLKKVGESGAP